MATGDNSQPTAGSSDDRGDAQGSQKPPVSGPKVTCLCLQTFTEGDRDYVSLTPPRVVDVEGRIEQTSMVCCNECWLQMTMFQRSMLSVVTTDARHGGLGVGQLLFERFWPDILRPFSGGVPDPSGDIDDVREAAPSHPASQHVPPGAAVSQMIDVRNERRKR